MTKAELEHALKRAEARAQREAAARKRAEATAEREAAARMLADTVRARAETDRETALSKTDRARAERAALSEILAAISTSSGDAQPVFDAIARSAAVLCGGSFSMVYRLTDGLVHLAGHHNISFHGWEAYQRLYPSPPSRTTNSGRAILDGQVVVTEDIEADAERVGATRDAARAVGTRSVASVPLLCDGRTIGALSVARSTAGPFSESDISLLQTFANQAVIAIENVRLFTELQDKNRALTQAHVQVTHALERQTATAEILSVISSSPTDVTPIYDAIMTSSIRLCEGQLAAVFRVDDELIHQAALRFDTPDNRSELLAWIRSMFPMRVNEVRGLLAQCLATRAPVNIEDIEQWPGVGRYTMEFARRIGWRSVLIVPMLREGDLIGLIGVYRRDPRRFHDEQVALLRTFADQAVIAIENVRLFTELQETNRALTQALDQQTATSEILRAISSSPTDIQPVFDAIATNAVRLGGGQFGVVHRYDGEHIYLMAHHNMSQEGPVVLRPRGPRRPARDTSAGRAVLTKSVVQIEDVESDEGLAETVHAQARLDGVRSMIAVPMLQRGQCAGCVVIGRREPGRFPEQYVALLETFADQAVIAIENVRLFTELQQKNRALTESLEQQTATSDVLRVISASPTDVQPTFDAIAASARRLCDAANAAVFRFDGELIHLVAHDSVQPGLLEAIRSVFPIPPGRGSITARAIAIRSVVQVDNLDQDPEHAFPAVRENIGTSLAVPLLRDGVPLGAITLGRAAGDVASFSDSQIELLKTFADQAVIAIENVRLFTELQDKNRALTDAHARVSEALDRQTASAEILRAISQSQTDVQPVFEAIVRNAIRLCGSVYGSVYRIDAGLIHLIAHEGQTPEQLAYWRSLFPRAVSGHGAMARAIRTRTVTRVVDVETDPEVPPEILVSHRARGVRTVLNVPMLRQNEVIGALSMTHREVGAFSDAHVELLKTFADQAVIAIENVRLFTELQEKNSALTEALEQQTATSEILRVISSSPTDVQPVFNAIVESATRLCDGFFGGVFQLDDGLLHLAAHHNFSADALAELHRTFPVAPGEDNLVGRTVLERVVVHVADMATDTNISQHSRELARRAGYRAFLAVPMLRDGLPVGAIAAARAESAFTEEQITLLKTFADQAVIAIENVRLFTELQEKNHALSEALDRQTASAEILRAISQSQTEVQPVFDAIADSAMRLLHAWTVILCRFDGELIHLAAVRGGRQEPDRSILDHFPTRPTTGLTVGRCIIERSVIQIADVEIESGPVIATRAMARTRGWRSALAVPMLRDGLPIGALMVTWAEPAGFGISSVDLLKTFADQAVIAIENARLLTELQARTRDLIRSVDQLTALGEVSRAVSSTIDLDRVLNTVVQRASQLAGADGCSIFEYDETVSGFRMRATSQVEGSALAAQRVAIVPAGEGAVGRLTETRGPVQIPDISSEEAYRSPLRDTLIAGGYRALLAVPMIREAAVVGGLVVSRKMPGEFPGETVELLQTFANQSALAIANARLFREIEEKSAQIEVANQHKSEFLANMSHELRTPLNAVIGFSDVLLEGMFGEINEKQAEYLRDILSSGKHLLSLINDILDLSKVEAGRMELDLSDFDVPQAISDALLLMRERAQRHGIALGQVIEERVAAVTADERKFKQVLLNLLSNAVKFTPAGGKVEVRARLLESMIEVAVADTGEGIAPEDQAAVFEEFRQVGKSAKKVEGTGLGLALCRKFVELHGGTITLESEVGVGSTFTFMLPVSTDEPT